MGRSSDSPSRTSHVADSGFMDVSKTGGVQQAVAMRMERVSQDSMKAEGEGAVALIEQAKAPPPPTDQKGTRINTYG